VHRLAGDWPTENAAGSITLDFDARHRRRIRVTGDQGEDILLNLPQAVAMAEGDGLQLEDGRWLKVQAAAELIVKSDIKIPISWRALRGISEIAISRLKFETKFFAFGLIPRSRICSLVFTAEAAGSSPVVPAIL
jgi:UreE urease accessory protein, N-terminal domain